MKRYNVIGSGTIYEDEEGRFVLHSDALAAIEQARREEREACAKLCEQKFEAERGYYHAKRASLEIAAAIRARKP